MHGLEHAMHEYWAPVQGVIDANIAGRDPEPTATPAHGGARIRGKQADVL
jgi:hypothetical protein